MRALWEQGYTLFKTDFRNGFHELLRQAMLDAVQSCYPALTSLNNLFYTRPWCLFLPGG